MAYQSYPWGWPLNYEYEPIYQPLYPSTHPRDGGRMEGALQAKDRLKDVHLVGVGILFGARPNFEDRRRYSALCRRINEQDRVIRQLQNNVAVLERALEVNDRRMINLLCSVLPGTLAEDYFPISIRAEELRRLAEFDMISLQERVRRLEREVTAATSAAERAVRLSQHTATETFRHGAIVWPDIISSEPNSQNENPRDGMRSLTLARGPQDDDELLTEGNVPPNNEVHTWLQRISESQARQIPNLGGYPNADTDQTRFRLPLYRDDDLNFYYEVGPMNARIDMERVDRYLLGQSMFSTSTREQARVAGDPYIRDEFESDSSEDGNWNETGPRDPDTGQIEDRVAWNRTGTLVAPALRRRQDRW